MSTPARGVARLPAGSSADEVAEAVHRMFSPHGDAALLERECDARVAAMVRDFLASSSVPRECPSPEAFAEVAVAAEPGAAGEYLDFLAEEVAAHSVNTAAPRVLGHMTTALPYFVRPLARLLAALNQNAVKLETSRAVTPLERQTLAQLHGLVYGGEPRFYAEHAQHPRSTLGVVVSGGTLANVTALWCARNRALGPADGFDGVEAEGLPAALEFHGWRDAVVVGSSLMHYSFDKAAGLLGLGTRRLLRVPVDRRGRMDPAALRATLADCRARRRRVLALVGIAGTTDAGSLDPLAELADAAEGEGIHLHVDAAWGGPLLFSPAHAGRLAGIERADSVAIDGHKQLYVPVGVGVLLFRDPAAAAAIEKTAHYIVRRESADLGKRTLEGSRPATALLLHAALRLMGRSGYAHLVEEGIRKAAYLARAVRRAPDLQLLAEPDTNIVLYRYLPEPLRARALDGGLDEEEERRVDALNVRLQEAQWAEGRSFVSRTAVALGGPRRVALRAVVSNPLTTEADLDAVLAEQRATGARLAAAGDGGRPASHPLS